jgi:NAD+ synthetase
VRFEIIPIGGIYEAFGAAVNPIIGWRKPEDFGKDVTEENVQARSRGMILMAYSNRTGSLVLTTGNKSELAVGYCTLYGDMAGGFAVISDLPKCLVFRLARYINETRGEVIPSAIIEKPPSAELRPGQKDQDSLPSYEILDEILRFYIEEELDAPAIIAAGLPAADVRWVLRKVCLAEYKRRQGALGLKVTTKAFGSGRRMPIARKF